MALLQTLPTSSLDAIAHVIQLAIAPVFLLTAVGTLLNVLTNRLGRAIDRRRVLEKLLEGPMVAGAAPGGGSRVLAELALITRRVALIYKAIVLTVLCALLICLLIAVAFADAFLALNLAKGLGALFILAMLALIGALLLFLREIFLTVSDAASDVAPKG